MSDFSELLQEAEKLTTDLEGPEFPRVDRSLKHVLEASNDLYSKVAQSGTKDIQANLLLGSKGVDLPKIVQKLESISTKRTFEPIKQADDYDIDNRLENEIRNRILQSFDSGFNEMLSSTYQNAWEHQAAEWKQQKRKVLHAISGPSGATIEWSHKSQLVLEKPIMTSTNLGPIESIYVSKIMEYTNTITKGINKPNLVNVFTTISEQFKDAKIKDMWEIVKYMADVPPFPQSEDAVKTRYTKSYTESLVKQGKKYLEDRYKTYMNNIINENLSVAGRGGVPGTYPLVRSFVGLRLQGEYLGLRDGTIDERPLWPMVYYCLRSGDLAATIYCLRKSSAAEFQELIALLEMKLNNPNSPEIVKLEDKVRFSYRRFVRNETDPFKRITWAVLGCCDCTDEHTEVARTADDYLWLKLSLVRVDYPNDDNIKYNDLQYTILEEYGESHYDAFNQPHLFFQVLALTGQFEAALEFLTRIEKFKAHAVHMAIALNELYMLAAPQDNGSPLICVDPLDKKPARRLNMARLIMIYVRTFELSCPNEAMHYFYLLRNHTDANNENLFKISVADLVVETKYYEKILGRVSRNGVRTKGLIDQFLSTAFTTESIAKMVADNLTAKGLYEEAIDVYDVANYQEEVLNLLGTMLSQVVHLENEPGSLRDRLQEKAITLANRYANDGYKTKSSTVKSFLKLKDLIIFFDQYHAKLYPQAMKTLNEIQIVALQQGELDERVRTFKSLNADVAKVIPDVLLATMNILFAQYQKLKSNEYVPRFQENSIEKQLVSLREQAKTLTNYAGMLPYRMPGDTNSRLIQMEILMH